MLDSSAKNENGKIPAHQNSEKMGFRLRTTDVFTLYREASLKGLVGEDAHNYVYNKMQKDGEWFSSNLGIS
jgi:hypothetical protein